MPFWYERDRILFESEIATMNKLWPESQYGFFEDGRMYWKVKICPIICGKRKEWTILAVYCSNYPAYDSFRFYPVNPSYNEMTEMVRLSEVAPKVVPHLFRDSDGTICFDIACFDIANSNDVHSSIVVESIVPGIALVARWINFFELGIIEPKTWELWNSFVENNGGDNCE